MKRKVEDTKKSKVTWTDEEDDALLKAVLEDRQNRQAEGDGDEDEDWDEIAKAVPGKTPVQCLKRYMTNFKEPDSSEAAPEHASRTEAKDDKDGNDESDDEEEDDDDDDDDEEDDDSGSPNKPKKIKKESHNAPGWNHDEIELLKKLVEQYKDSKFADVQSFVHDFSPHLIQVSNSSYFRCTPLE